ncbi:MAG: YqjF family protein [Planctomycetota bacterium]
MPETLVPVGSDPLALTTARFAFLSAEWRRLCLLTFAVEPARLEPLLPPGLALDTRDGQAFVSLVAFDFLRTRVLGVPWPGYRDFPEINLRFYVREGERRGVAFVRELVPKRLIAWLARLLYNEPYLRAPMQSSHTRAGDELVVEHRLWMGGREQRLRVTAGATPSLQDPASTAHFFKEHTWGYGTSRRGRLVRYEVRHPHWETYPVRDVALEWDWGLVYGPEWADLGERAPDSVVLAEGSPVRVSPAG